MIHEYDATYVYRAHWNKRPFEASIFTSPIYLSPADGHLALELPQPYQHITAMKVLNYPPPVFFFFL